VQGEPSEDHFQSTTASDTDWTGRLEPDTEFSSALDQNLPYQENISFGGTQIIAASPPESDSDLSSVTKRKQAKTRHGHEAFNSPGDAVHVNKEIDTSAYDQVFPTKIKNEKISVSSVLSNAIDQKKLERMLQHLFEPGTYNVEARSYPLSHYRDPVANI
jgi:hypothetical protein